MLTFVIKRWFYFNLQRIKNRVKKILERQNFFNISG